MLIDINIRGENEPLPKPQTKAPAALQLLKPKPSKVARLNQREKSNLATQSPTLHQQMQNSTTPLRILR